MHVNTRHTCLVHAYIYSTDVLYILCSAAILNFLFLAVGKELDSPPPLEIGSSGYGYPMFQDKPSTTSPGKPSAMLPDKPSATLLDNPSAISPDSPSATSLEGGMCACEHKVQSTPCIHLFH